MHQLELIYQSKDYLNSIDFVELSNRLMDFSKKKISIDVRMEKPKTYIFSKNPMEKIINGEITRGIRKDLW